MSAITSGCNIWLTDMKVLFVSSGKSSDGISPVVSAQGRSLQKSGVRVDYFAIGGKGLFSYLKAVPRLRRLLDGGNHDLVHAHYGLCGLVALMAVRRQKLVVSFMGDDLLGSRKQNGKIRPSSRIMSALNAFISARFYDHTIVKSERMLRPGLKINSVTVIPNGVDTDLFRPMDRNETMKVTGWDPRHRHVIFVSDPSRSEKNYPLAKLAVDYLHRNDTELHAVIGIDQSMMPYYYGSADALLLTSFHEGSANAIKEAMACNCPVISTDTGDASVVTSDTSACFIVPWDHIAISSIVERAIEYRIKNGETNGRERIVSMGLDSVAVADRIIRIYKKVLE